MNFLQESESDTRSVMTDHKVLLHGNVCWKELLSRAKLLVVIDNKLAKSNTPILYIMKPLNYDSVLPSFILCDDQLE